MGISVRKLREWRREALAVKCEAADGNVSWNGRGGTTALAFAERILRLTQELMDRELLEGSRKGKERAQ